MEPVFTMIVAVVGIGCFTGIIHRYLETKLQIARALAEKGSDSVAAELKALREEVRQLREQNADLILSFDTTLQRLGAASASLPARAAAAPPAEAAQQVNVRSG
jgi:hypothetical protein